MEENLKENTQIFYKRLNICKRFPINQVIKIQLPLEENEEGVNVSIGIVKGYLVLEKDIDGLKAGEFVLEVESGFDKRELFKSYVVKPEFCTPINEEIYTSSINDNSEKSLFIKERLLISDEVHQKNIDIVKEFKLGSVVEVTFKLSNSDTKQELVKRLLGKVIGYVHIFENKECPGLFSLELELFHMQNELNIYSVNQKFYTCPSTCKVI